MTVEWLAHAIDARWPAGAGRPILTGPSMNVRADYLQDFLAALEAHPGRAAHQQVLQAVSYHMYPGYGRSSDLPRLRCNGKNSRRITRLCPITGLQCFAGLRVRGHRRIAGLHPSGHSPGKIREGGLAGWNHPG